MKKIIYISIAFLSLLSITACEDTETNSATNWTYEKPYFEFEYITDTVSFGAGGHQMNYAVEDIQKMFLGMAAAKMQSYFKGIELCSEDTLLIKAQTATGIPFNIHAHYQKDAQYLEITLNSKEMGTFLGDKAAMIPAISFRYLEEGNRMTLYLGEVYIQTIFENTQIQKMLLPMVAQSLNPRFNMMPEPAQQAMMKGLQEQISAILDNIVTLKIGFVLKQ